MDSVVFAYEDAEKNAVDGVTLHIKAGEHVAFVGPSGGGKTTLASLIARFRDVKEGSIKLSGGERQRISIARAFLKDAPIILMDEATASLDVDNESLIQETISRLIQNKTVLIIAHRMRTVDGVDKIVVLRDGIVAESGTPKELKEADGIYRHMVELQLRSEQWKY